MTEDISGTDYNHLRRADDHRKTDDPSALTTKQLLRELGNLKAIIDARFDGNDRVIALIQARLDNKRENIKSEVAHLRTLHDEKFSSIQIQFSERDTRAEQTSKDSKVAVDAALQAAKEAVGEQNKSSALAIAKSETGTTKQIDQIGININSISLNLNDKIDDVKARLLTIDGLSKGNKDNKDDSRSTIAISISVIMAIITVGTLLYNGGNKRETNATPPVPQIIYMPPTQPITAPMVK